MLWHNLTQVIFSKVDTVCTSETISIKFYLLFVLSAILSPMKNFTSFSIQHKNIETPETYQKSVNPACSQTTNSVVNKFRKPQNTFQHITGKVLIFGGGGKCFNESVVYCGAAHCCFLFSFSPPRHLLKVTMSKNVIYNYSNGSGVCEINFLSNWRPKLDLLYPPFCDHTEIHRWKKSFLALIGFIDGNI